MTGNVTTLRKKKPIKDFGRVSFEQIGLRPVRAPEFVIDDWMVAREVSFIGGEPQAGKTFVAMHAALSISTGTPIFGRKTQKGLTIYQLGESGGGASETRVPAWRDYFKDRITGPVPFELLTDRFNLFGPENDLDDFIKCVERIALDYPDDPLRLIVVDTFSKVMRGGDEISGKDVGEVLDRLEMIARITGAHVCAVHHLPKGGNSLRGHTSLKGDVHTVCFVYFDAKTGIRSMRFDKVKDGPAGDIVKFETKQIVIGRRPEDNKEITSCVVVELTAETEQLKRAAIIGHPLKPKEEPLFQAFWTARKEKGFLADEDAIAKGAPPGTIVITSEAFRDAYRSGRFVDSGKEVSDDAIRKIWERNGPGLIKYEILKVARPYTWWTGKPVRGYPDTVPRRDKNGTDDGPDDMDDYQF